MSAQHQEPAAQDRVMRVFVSSTFRDMQEEREELVKQVFPRLRSLCESRGVTWGEVDLRWGVTDEQKADGMVLPICLAEIERSRPYFIGMLGERYGWVPDGIDPELVSQEPWLSKHREKSVTELEILHGALNDPEMANHAFFYLRDPGYANSRPAGQYRELATPEEIAKLGAAEAERRAQARRDELAALKDEIRASGFPVCDGYSDPRALGEAVLADLMAVLDRLYPAGSEPDPLVRAAAEHEAFARSRVGVYIGRSEYTKRLDDHVKGEGPPLVILGESGSGKSALLANWALSYRRRHPEELVLMHFCGASPASTDWASMLRRIMSELARRFELRLEIPDSPGQLRLAFANALHMAAAKGSAIVVLDALNQLEDRDGAPDLAWLPPELPASIRLIVSTLPGRPLDELNSRGWPALHVEPLKLAERQRLIVEYLAQYTKALDAPRAERIASAAQTVNPLFLRTLLEELRLCGQHEALDNMISHYLSAPTIDSLFELILARYETDYERDRPGLVADAMTHIWAARRGLGESELLDLAGDGGNPLPRAYWSPLYLAAERALVMRSGLLGFAHDYLRQAVEHRYLRTAADRDAAHLRLASYFQARELGSRQVDELPWQLAEAREWQRLSDLLGDLQFLEEAWDFNPFDVKIYWTRLEADSPLRALDAYRSVVDRPADHQGYSAWLVSTILSDRGYNAEALALISYFVAQYRRTGDSTDLGRALINQAFILDERGDLDGALTLYKEQETISREAGDKSSVGKSINGQASILYRRGDFDGALALNSQAQDIFRELGDQLLLAMSLGSRGSVLHSKGDLDGAMALHREAERIFRELGDMDELAHAFNNEATILIDRGDLRGAIALSKQDERICRELGSRAALAGALNTQAVALSELGDSPGALALLKESEGVWRELGNRSDLATSLVNQGLLVKQNGDLERAMRLQREAEGISRELNDKAGIQASLGNQAAILKARRDLKGALSLYREKERICREIGDHEGLATSLFNQALIQLEMKKKREAKHLADESLRLAEENNYESLVHQIRSLRAKWGF